MKENSEFYQRQAETRFAFSQIAKGGAKRFLYTGPKRELEDGDQWSFTPRHQQSTPSIPVDLTNVWSIQKNVSLGGHKPMASERSSQLTTKSFYSRHGGLKDNEKLKKPAEKSETGAAWTSAQGSNFSYSFNGGRDGTGSTNRTGDSSVNQGYRADLSPRSHRFEQSRPPLDENDF